MVYIVKLIITMKSDSSMRVYFTKERFYSWRVNLWKQSYNEVEIQIYKLLKLIDLRYFLNTLSNEKTWRVLIFSGWRPDSTMLHWTFTSSDSIFHRRQSAWRWCSMAQSLPSVHPGYDVPWDQIHHCWDKISC